MKRIKIWTTGSFTFAGVKSYSRWCLNSWVQGASHGGRGVSVRCRGSFGFVLWVKLVENDDECNFSSVTTPV